MNKSTVIGARVLKGTVSNFIGKFISLATLFLLTPFMLHQLGDTAYGLWVLIGSVISYGSLLDIGIWGAIIKYVAEYRARGEYEQASQVFVTAFSLYGWLCLIILLLTWLVAPVFPVLFHVPEDQKGTATQLVILMGFGVGFSLPGMAPMAVLRGLQRFDIVNLIEVIATLFTALATVAVLLWGGGVLGVVFVQLCGIFVMLGLGVWFVLRIAPEFKIRRGVVNLRLIRTVLTYSWPLFVRDVASNLKTKTDEMTIGAFLPFRMIAPYNLARKMSETTHILTQQFMKVLLPLTSELHAENDLGRLRLVYTTGTRLTLAISLTLASLLIVLARPILSVWVGERYANAAPLVVILTLATLVATSQWPANTVLQGMARHRLLAATSLGSGVANLLLSIALIGPLGLTGVALGTLIPNVVEFAIVIPFAMRVMGVRGSEAVRKIFLPALSPALIMTLALLALQKLIEPSTLISIGLIAGMGVLVYMVAYLCIGASKAERQIYLDIAFPFGLSKFAQKKG